ARCVSFRGPGTDRRAHRTQRRRQDDAAADGDGPTILAKRRNRLRRPFPGRGAGAPKNSAWHWLHGGGSAPQSGTDGERERAASCWGARAQGCIGTAVPRLPAAARGGEPRGSQGGSALRGSTEAGGAGAGLDERDDDAAA